MAEQFPEIAGWVPKKPRSWETEPGNTIYFEALGLAAVVLDGRGDAVISPRKRGEVAASPRRSSVELSDKIFSHIQGYGQRRTWGYRNHPSYPHLTSERAPWRMRDSIRENGWSHGLSAEPYTRYEEPCTECGIHPKDTHRMYPEMYPKQSAISLSVRLENARAMPLLHASYGVAVSVIDRRSRREYVRSLMEPPTYEQSATTERKSK